MAQEFETKVLDIDVKEIDEKLTKLGAKNDQEVLMRRWVFTIDSWPKIPALLEVEADSEEKVKHGLQLLELEGKDVGNMTDKAVYAKYGFDLHAFKELKF